MTEKMMTVMKLTTQIKDELFHIGHLTWSDSL